MSAVYVAAAFFVLVEVLVAVFSRLVHQSAVGVAEFDVGGIFDAHGNEESVATEIHTASQHQAFPDDANVVDVLNGVRRTTIENARYQCSDDNITYL